MSDQNTKSDPVTPPASGTVPTPDSGKGPHGFDTKKATASVGEKKLPQGTSGRSSASGKGPHS